jgi:triacylglycerol lipase
MKIATLRSPIVLVHGLLGYDEIKFFGRRIACYFPGIPELFRSAGNRVLIPRISPTEGAAERASQLKAFLDAESPGEPVHFIAHSLGGLDARYLISRLDMAHRVLTLTTIATPHRGSAFADWGIQRLARLLRPMFRKLAISGQAFYDLTTDNCRAFNKEVPDAAKVRYFSVAGRYHHHLFCPEWHLPHQIVSRAEGPNDGVVSVASASYGESTEIWEGDHLSLVNWINYRSWLRGYWKDPLPQYAGLIGRLSDEGF